MVEKGIFEFEVDGKKVGFKFGMYAAAITQKESGSSIIDLFKIMAQGNDGGVALLQYFYGGAVSYATNKKLTIPTIDEVGDWIEVIGWDESLKVYSESIKTYISKNAEPLKAAS